MKKKEKRGARIALAAMTNVLNSSIEGAKENHDALEHRDESIGSECWTRFHLDDIRAMIEDARREVGA